jgi:arylsulfatase A-like enzyme
MKNVKRYLREELFTDRRDFLKMLGLGAASFTLPSLMAEEIGRSEQRPNIVLIMADDMGFSDIGCYGGEIPTPHIDALAAGGLRFTQFYNTARCSPTRASLLTGLHPHQTGVGILAEDPGQQADSDAAPGYTRYLNKKCITLAEALKPAGYHTYMAGKWHLGYHGQEKWPRQRGFDRYYGCISGAVSYFKPMDPRGLTLDNTPLPPTEDPDFYTTDAFTDYAMRFVREQEDDNPFFLYLAFNAPHWPLHAPQKDVEKFVGKYRGGWDQVRQERYARLVKEGIISKDWPLSPRDDARAWETLTEEQKTQMDYRMAVYAAQVHRMDWNIGRLVQMLQEMNKYDNTLILFLSDNGGCAEPYFDLGGGDIKAVNRPDAGWVGGKGTGMGGSSYGTGWANASNTPFRRFKSMLHEGGIAAPLVVHWPKGLKTKPGTLTHSPGYLTDVMPTALEVAETSYPVSFNAQQLHPLAGRSLVPIFQTGSRPDPEWMFWEQYGNRAVRHGNWKAVRPEEAKEWELYDLEKDRTELNDLARQYPDVLSRMTEAWENWAKTNQVLPKKLPMGNKS